MPKQKLRIGGALAFWGDTDLGAIQLARHGLVDYLIFDYLAEVTMSIMARAAAKDPQQGFAHDFAPGILKKILPEVCQQGIKIVTNAGGVNPLACAESIRQVLREAGVNLKVAVIEGDNLIDRYQEWSRWGIKEVESGEIAVDNIMSVNAYLGAFPIAKALSEGADIVVTGRCVDSALTLGPCIHHFGWRADQYDLLSSGSLAGHIIECGSQACGGNFTDWQDSADWHNIGFPIAEIKACGEITLTKPSATGGLVSVGTVSEQIIYEIGDPGDYPLPDVRCDWRSVTIVAEGDHRVTINGARGYPPTSCYKVSATFSDGYRLGLYMPIIGAKSETKARRTADAIVQRCHVKFDESGLAPFQEVSIETIGTENEVVLKLAAKHKDPKALKILLREATSASTSMAPGICGMGGVGYKVSPVVRLFSFLLNKRFIEPVITIDDRRIKMELQLPQLHAECSSAEAAQFDYKIDESSLEQEVALYELAYARSGDKGDNVNIGVIARKPEYLPYIREALSESRVSEFMRFCQTDNIERFDMPGINAVNFLLHNALGGGGMASLRYDPQGKSFAQRLLQIKVPVPATLLSP